jgi:molybdopterin-guanine dinucleotide biosynthesis protein A
MNSSSAIILAGGKSSRMGRPKALLPFGGEPLIAHIVRSLKQLFRDIVIVASPDQILPALPVTLVRDEIAYRGPVSGIYYGLGAAEGSVSFVGSCDMPFLNLSLISHLLAQIADHDVVVPHWNGRYQPLFAVYRNHVAPLLKGQLERGELRPITLLNRVRTRVVDEGEVRRFDSEGLSFLNMNTPADYEAALQRWRHLRAAAESGSSVSISCTVELLGVARLRAGTKTVALELPSHASLRDVFRALSEKIPDLVGSVLAPPGDRLVDGQACNINGQNFVRDMACRVYSGDRVFIVSADAGG